VGGEKNHDHSEGVERITCVWGKEGERLRPLQSKAARGGGEAGHVFILTGRGRGSSVGRGKRGGQSCAWINYPIGGGGYAMSATTHPVRKRGPHLLKKEKRGVFVTLR